MHTCGEGRAAPSGYEPIEEKPRIVKIAENGVEAGVDQPVDNLLVMTVNPELAADHGENVGDVGILANGPDEALTVGCSMAVDGADDQ